MLAVLIWWVVIQLITLAALPITMRLLRFLPDRGIGCARPVGLLLVSYTFWLLCTLGFLQNTAPSLVAVVLGLGVASVVLFRSRRGEMAAFLRQNWRQVLVGELLFLVALGLFAVFRAYNPDIAHTEKPMEYAFLNAILRSEAFPPHDPWLSGFAISYYYLGYVVMAVLTRLSGLESAITFNLTNAMLFAMTLSGAYSVVWNMVQVHRQRRGDGGGGTASAWGATLAGLFGGFMVALMGNLEGVFEIIHAKGWGSPALWEWLDVRNLGTTSPSYTWLPQDGWWWWRASRVIHDRDALGRSAEVISEFPFFSFLLGDNHPHVLALPFVLLAVALALNVLAGRAGRSEAAAAVTCARERSYRGLLESLWLGWSWDIPLWALLLGALSFLNTWDYPIYLGLFILAYGVRRYVDDARTGWSWLGDTAALGLILLGLSIALYAPFYLGFRSQAGGVVLGTAKTQTQQYFLMFGTQIVVLAAFLAARAAGLWQATTHLTPVRAGVGIALALVAAMFLALGWWTAGGVMLMVVAASVLLACAVCGQEDGRPGSPAVVLALAMAIVGLLLTVAVEVGFLRDTFGTRMNTVFKFYYQAWVLLSLAGAFGAYYVVVEVAREGFARRLAVGAWMAAGTVLVLAGSTYTVAATISKAGAFRGEPTLDGTRYVATYRPWEHDAVAWLRDHAPSGAVLLEAPGGSYTEYNWVSAATGIPTLLGWGGHQLQWRGSYDEPARREPDIALVYEGAPAEMVAEVLERYGVEYVLVGPNERSRYGVGPAALRALETIMTPVHENERITIYGRHGRR